MKIELQGFIPDPLLDMNLNSSEFWQNDQHIVNLGEVNYYASQSGRGKSSLISSIYGIRKDYQGRILFDEDDIATFSVDRWSQIRQEKLSIVFQSLELFKEVSALDNILVKNQLQQFKTYDEIISMMELLEVQEITNQLAGTLSYGQRQRIAIIRALCQPFSILLLDEPFSHLDQKNAEKAWELIWNESKKQNAQIMITGLSNDPFFCPDEKYFL